MTNALPHFASIFALPQTLLTLLLLLPLPGQELPAGTKLDVRLKSKVASESSKADDPVEAVLLIPVVVQNQVLVHAGAIVQGKVTQVHAIDQSNPRATLKLEFNTLIDPKGKGKTTQILARVSQVDNAREAVDEAGQITGIIPSETLSARMDQGLEKLAARLGGLASVLQTAKDSFVQESKPEILYTPGVEIQLELVKPASPEGSPEGLDALSVKPIQDEDKLVALVNEQPFQTVADKPPRPSDITNLMFLGSRELVESAFKQAGWSPAAERNRKSEIETLRAIVEARGYSEAPVSVLLLADQKPDLVFQKQNNTFAKRHHLRIWRRPGSFLDRDIWVSSATHDIGIAFSKATRQFTHRIDGAIDGERAKVMADLALAGAVDRYSMVERPAIPLEVRRADGAWVTTDGEIAVVFLREP